MEIGFTIPEMESNEITDDGKLKTIKSLEGMYVFVDVILGVKKDILLEEEDMGNMYNIDTEFAFKFFTNTAYTLTNTANENIKLVPQPDNSVGIEFEGIVPYVLKLIEGVGEHILVDGGIALLGLLGFLKLKRVGVLG